MRVFVYDGRRYPDNHPDKSVEEVRLFLANYFPELSNATVKESKDGDDTVYTFERRVGTKGVSRVTVHLEDQGQDFLEWDVEDGVVVACRPFQGWVWKGTRVHNTSIAPGDILHITTPGGRKTTLSYPVEKVG